jgi:hypothetical protein
LFGCSNCGKTILKLFIETKLPLFKILSLLSYKRNIKNDIIKVSFRWS